MRSVNVPHLRRQLLGTNKIPKDFEGVFPDVELVDLWKEYICITDVFITKPYSGGF